MTDFDDSLFTTNQPDEEPTVKEAAAGLTKNIKRQLDIFRAKQATKTPRTATQACDEFLAYWSDIHDQNQVCVYGAFRACPDPFLGDDFPLFTFMTAPNYDTTHPTMLMVARYNIAKQRYVALDYTIPVFRGYYKGRAAGDTWQQPIYRNIYGDQYLETELTFVVPLDRKGLDVVGANYYEWVMGICYKLVNGEYVPTDITPIHYDA